MVLPLLEQLRVEDRLAPYLPEGQSRAVLIELLQSPPFRQQVDSFTYVLKSEDSYFGINNGDDSSGINEVIDNEREEGELEEGEIDLESELIQVEEKGGLCGRFGGLEEEEELEDRVPLIRKVLENVNATEAEKSFDVVCARLRSSVESLQQLVLHCWFPSKDALIEQSFMGFKCVHSVFWAMSPIQRDQNRSAMTRLLTYAMGLQPALFSPEQMKEYGLKIFVITSFKDTCYIEILPKDEKSR